MRRLGLALLAAGMVVILGCPGKQGPSSPSGPTRTPTATLTVTDSPTLAPTGTSTSTLSETPTETITPTRTRTSTRTRTLTPTITPTETQTQTPWPGTGTGLRGDYYNGEAFNTAVLTRVDPVISFNLGTGSPDPLVDADHFSAKWTGEVQAPYSGPITFITISDDGVRLWVDGTLVIDNYTPHSFTQDEGVLTLTAGQKYPIELDYYESTGSAVMNLGWKAENIPSLFIAVEYLYPATVSPPTSTPSDTPTITATPTTTMTPTITATPTKTGTPWPGIGTGLRGDYYNEVDFSQFVLTRGDAQVDFNFGTGSPDPSVDPDAYSIRWTGEVQAPNSGPITFVTNSDDGVRLWVNGTLIIDDYSPHGPTLDEGVVNLTAGQKYPVQMDYYQNFGGALISLGWKSDNVPTQVVPSQYLYPAPGLPTATPTSTFTATATSTDTWTATLTRTFTPTLTFTASPTVTNSPSETPTFSVTRTPTLTPSATPTGTPSFTGTSTHTPTITRTSTATLTRTPCSSSVTFGITSPGATSPDNFPNYTTVFYSNFIANSSGTLSKVGFWLATFPANYQVAVYTVDGSGYAVTPVSVSNIQSADTGGSYQWAYFNMPPATILNGTTYALLAWFKDGNPPTVPRLSGSPGTYKIATLSGSDLSNPPVFFSSQPYLLNIQAVVCP